MKVSNSGATPFAHYFARRLRLAMIESRVERRETLSTVVPVQ